MPSAIGSVSKSNEGENLQGKHEERPGKFCLEHSDERGGGILIPGIDDNALLGALFVLDTLCVTLALVFEKLLFTTKLVGEDGGHMGHVAGIGEGIDGLRGRRGRLGWASNR